MYRCEAVSVEGFIQQLAVGYVQHGYWFYVTGTIPKHKDPLLTDMKIIQHYGIGIPRWARSRRKARQLANVQYLRHGRFFVILATHGEHALWEEEAGQLRDIRRAPIEFAGYSVGYTKGRDGQYHVSVRIQREEYRRLRSHLIELATHRSVENLIIEFQRLPFEPYARVRVQYFSILKAVNEKRKQAGFDPVPVSALRLYRRVVRPFNDGVLGCARGEATGGQGGRTAA